MHIYMRNIRAKFHPDPIWNDGSWGFFEDGRPNNNSEYSTDMYVMCM